MSPRNQGPLSVDSLNTLLQDVLNPASPDLAEIKCFNYTLRRGDRIIIKKNDYENDVFNGDIGKVIHIGGGNVSVLIDGRSVSLPVDELEGKLKLAYAITVHSSQGQEYKYVILPFINQYGKNMLQRNLLYTAITRAKEKVIIVGHGSAIERAINNSSVHQRNTRLGERIKSCIQLKKNGSSAIPLSVLEDSVLTLKEPSSLEENKSSPMAVVEESFQNANMRYQQFMMQFSAPEM